MLDSSAPVGIKPMKVACLTNEVWPRTKSSAVSVSNSPVPDGLDKVPIKPSGVPVLNNKAALAGRTKAMTHASTISVFFTTVPPIGRRRFEAQSRILLCNPGQDRLYSRHGGIGRVLCAPV